MRRKTEAPENTMFPDDYEDHRRLALAGWVAVHSKAGVLWHDPYLHDHVNEDEAIRRLNKRQSMPQRKGGT